MGGAVGGSTVEDGACGSSTLAALLRAALLEVTLFANTVEGGDTVEGDRGRRCWRSLELVRAELSGRGAIKRQVTRTALLGVTPTTVALLQKSLTREAALSGAAL